MEIIARLLYSIAGILIVYFTIRRWTGKSGKEFNSKFLRYFAILFGLAVGFELLINWTNSESKIVTQSVEQLKAVPEIKREIGNFKGYSYNKNKIKEIDKLPAQFDLTLYGRKAEIHLSVLIDSSNNNFEVKAYKIMDTKGTDP